MADKNATVAEKVQKELEPYQQLMQRLASKSEAGELFAREDAWQLAKDAVNAIAQATTADELFEASEKSAGLQSMGREWPHLNNPINLIEITFRKSDERFSEGTLGHYAIVHYALDGTGELNVVGVGAPNVVAFLEKWENLPEAEKRKASRVVVKSKATGRGELLRIARP